MPDFKACMGGYDCDCAGCRVCEDRLECIDATITSSMARLRHMSAMASDISARLTDEDDKIGSDDAAYDESDGIVAITDFDKDEDSLVIELQSMRRKTATASQQFARRRARGG